MRFPIIPIDATASTVLALLAALPLAISVFVVVSGGGPARYFASQSWISLEEPAVFIQALQAARAN
ncbi:MAG: hypothetical protein OXH45_01150 [Gammaproteobacteria bacterium]|nr:hypothetical protein [Gammaproteobacteria bacterium]